MDSDFEEKCQEIAKKRRDRKVSVSKYLPPYINTPLDDCESNTNKPSEEKSGNQVNAGTSKSHSYRKRKIPSWQRGYLSNKKKRKREQVIGETTVTDDQVV